MDPTQKNSVNELLKLLILALILGVLVVAGWKLSPLLLPQAEMQAPLNPACDVHNGPCEARFPDGTSLKFSVEPRTIPLLEPLALRVETQGLEPTQVEVDINGVEMKMGFNRPKLESQGNGVFQGSGTLPVCVRSRMLWEVVVLVQTPRGSYAAPFRFWTVHGAPPP